MRILIAPDKFKGSLGAEAVAQQIATGLRAVLPEAILELMPIADGGEGTAEVICRARQGDWITCLAQDALGRVQTARYAWIASSNQAVMDMSATAGLSQLAHGENQIMQASTFGVGEMLLHAVAQQVSEVVIGLGGSATNDGGFGLARALGFRFLAKDQRELFDLSSLLSLQRIVRPNDLALPRLIAACDVRNALLGADGATHTFAAQKGATAAEVKDLEHTLARLAEVAAEAFGRDDSALPGAGAAGGLGFGLVTFCQASIRPGFDVVAEAIDLPEKIRRADIIITGEGKLDRQTLAGKAPAGVARLARRLGKPVYAIVGQLDPDVEIRQLFDRVMTLNDPDPRHGGTKELLAARAGELASSESIFLRSE